MRTSDLESCRDEELVRAFVAKGDAQALEVVLRRHQQRVFGLAYRILGNRADALDATQEALINVFRKAHSFKGEAAFTTWLYRLAVNACHDLARKRSRAPEPLETVEVADPYPDPVAASDDRLAIKQALSFLSEEQRAAVVMRDLYGLSYQEIAEATRVAVGTVKSRIARARISLAGRLGTVETKEPGG
ncbi:MAG: RNA polymerase sigma factor [Actinomycetota bacterium]